MMIYSIIKKKLKFHMFEVTEYIEVISNQSDT